MIKSIVEYAYRSTIFKITKLLLRRKTDERFKESGARGSA